MSRDIAPFGVRMPPGCKYKIEQSANQNGRSINAEIVQRLERSLEQDEGNYPFLISLLEALGLTPVQRLCSSHTTYGDRDRLVEYAQVMPDTFKVVVSVRDGHANYSAMTVIFLGRNYTLVGDTSSLTVEREPRQLEVLELFKKLDKRGLLDVTEFATTRTKQTKELSPKEALDYYQTLDTKLLRGNIYEFLSLFFRAPENVEPTWFNKDWESFQ